MGQSTLACFGEGNVFTKQTLEEVLGCFSIKPQEFRVRKLVKKGGVKKTLWLSREVDINACIYIPISSEALSPGEGCKFKSEELML